MKKTKRQLRCLVIILLCFCALISGCTSQNVLDKSERLFRVAHFNGDVTQSRSLSVSNGEVIFYVDGNSIYRYGLDKAILEDVDYILTLAASDNYLYILPYTGELIIIDIETNEIMPVRDEMKKVVSIAADKDNFFFCTEEDIYYFSEKTPDCIFSFNPDSADMHYFDSSSESEGRFNNFVTTVNGTDIIYRFGLIVISDGQSNRMIYSSEPKDSRSSYHLCNDSVFFVGEGFVMHGDESYSDDKYSDYFGVERNRFIRGDTVYELIQRANYTASEWGPASDCFELPQYKIVDECIIGNDLDRKRPYEVYRTKNNQTRIVGYDGKRVYLFDTESYMISSYDCLTGETIEIMKTDELDRLTFEWCKNILFIYDKKQNVIDIIET